MCRREGDYAQGLQEGQGIAARMPRGMTVSGTCQDQLVDPALMTLLFPLVTVTSLSETRADLDRLVSWILRS